MCVLFFPDPQAPRVPGVQRSGSREAGCASGEAALLGVAGAAEQDVQGGTPPHTTGGGQRAHGPAGTQGEGGCGKGQYLHGIYVCMPPGLWHQEHTHRVRELRGEEGDPFLHTLREWALT